MFSRWDIKYSPYLYVAPFFVLFGVFGLYPLLMTAYMSLTDWNLIGDRSFVGLENYSALLVDEYFWNAVRNTFAIFLIATVPQMFLALFLATLLNRPLRARTFWRMLIFVPNVTSLAAVAVVFGVFFRRDFGIVNYFIGLVGIDPISWRTEQWPSWIALATMIDWRWTGYNTLIFLAAMQAIPKDLYESAALDGAGRWRQFLSITLPGLRPTLFFVVIISTIGGWQLFTEPLIFNGGGGAILGGARREFQTVAMYMYEKAFDNLQFGYGSAVAFALFALIVIFSVLNYLLVRRSVRN
ncbi:sugar ABC transporter permease [Rhizocola hellebori]|uniref:Sugar ABC transporter permease n=1 Tax=Rhizocola hellebori TaxID=1392758 RepID=A0A8J3Q7J4_9ACTN|nr:sugar ABC transporter permease [Rhizocola hellebori]